MEWPTILGVLGVSNLLSILITWFLGGKRASNANASLIEIDAINRMKDYYRDEIERLVRDNQKLNENIAELSSENICYDKTCKKRQSFKK